MFFKKKIKKIEEVRRIQSIYFYRDIYNKACHSFWEIRPFFVFLSLVGTYLIAGDLAIFVAYLFKGISLIPFSLFFLFFLLGIATWVPMILFFYRQNAGRSKKYLEYLKELKVERGLDNSDINELLEDICYLKNKYAKQRNSLFKVVLEVGKIIIIPITVAIFTTSIGNVHISWFILFSICIICLILWANIFLDYRMFEFLKQIGIKDFYMVESVEKELKYMKKLK